MDVKVKVVGAFVAGAAAIFLAGGVGIVEANFLFTKEKLYKVQLTPQGENGGTLRAQLKKGKKCSQNFEGCMKFAEDKVGLIRFYLPGSKKQERECPGARKVITKIELSTTPDAAFPEGDKGDFAGGVDPWLKQDAFPLVDQATGVIYDETTATGKSRVWLVNQNSHDSSLGTRPFWYQVTVTSCNGTQKWVTDPRGENTGLN